MKEVGQVVAPSLYFTKQSEVYLLTLSDKGPRECTHIDAFLEHRAHACVSAYISRVCVVAFLS